VIAVVLAAVLAAAAGHPAAPGPPPHEPLRFEGLAWDASRAEVERVLAARHYVREAATAEDEEPTWRGRAFGRIVHVSPEFTPAGGLLALDVRFEADARGSALQRYAELVAAMRRRHGPPTAEVAPGRPVTEERLDRFGRLRRYGDRTAATLWTDAPGAGAVVQLGRDDALWLRYESPRWNELHPADDAQR